MRLVMVTHAIKVSMETVMESRMLMVRHHEDRMADMEGVKINMERRNQALVQSNEAKLLRIRRPVDLVRHREA